MAKELMSKDEIKDIRLSLGMNQTEFAEEIGVNQAAVSLWESGGRSPSGPVLKLLHQFKAEKKSGKKSRRLAKVG